MRRSPVQITRPLDLLSLLQFALPLVHYVQPFTRLVQHRVQPFADRRLPTVIHASLPFGPPVLAQGLAQPFPCPVPDGPCPRIGWMD